MSWPDLGDFEGFEENVWETDDEELDGDEVVPLGYVLEEGSSQGDSEMSGRDEGAHSGEENHDNNLLVDASLPVLEVAEVSLGTDSPSSEGEARENSWTVEARPAPPCGGGWGTML